MSKKSLTANGPNGVAQTIQKNILDRQMKKEVEMYLTENQPLNEVKNAIVVGSKLPVLKMRKIMSVSGNILFLVEDDTKSLTTKYLSNIITKLSNIEKDCSDGTPNKIKVVTATNELDLQAHLSEYNTQPYSCFIPHTDKSIFNNEVETVVMFDNKEKLLNRNLIFKSLDQRTLVIPKPSCPRLNQ